MTITEIGALVGLATGIFTVIDRFALGRRRVNRGTSMLVIRFVGTLTALLFPLMLVSAALAQEQIYQLPTATEVFRLRSACAELGEKILENNAISSNLTHDQVSHYEARTNRCYVQLTVSSVPSTPLDQYLLHLYLFDGQTKEMLATAKIEKGQNGVRQAAPHHKSRECRMG